MRDSINEVNGVIRITPSKKYRGVCIAIMAIVVAIMSVLFALVYPYVGLLFAIIGVLLVPLGYWLSGLRFYYIRDDGLITKKLFTSASVSTPFRNIGEIEEAAGVLEALCDCGTIIIRTSSGKPISWDHIEDTEQIAHEIRSRIGKVG